MESKDKPDSHCLWNSVQWETRVLLPSTIQDLSVSSAGFCISSAFLWQVVPAIRGLHQEHIDYRFELSDTCMHTLSAHTYTHTHIRQDLFFLSFAELLLLLLSGAAIQSYIQAFQKSDRIHAQLNYFILHSMSVPRN